MPIKLMEINFRLDIDQIVQIHVHKPHAQKVSLLMARTHAIRALVCRLEPNKRLPSHRTN